MPLAAITRDLVQTMIGRGMTEHDFAQLLLLQAEASGLTLAPENVEVSDGLSSACGRPGRLKPASQGHDDAVEFLVGQASTRRRREHETRKIRCNRPCHPLDRRRWCMQGWPTKPVRIVVPFTAGSATDILARTYGQKTHGEPDAEHVRRPVGGAVEPHDRGGDAARIPDDVDEARARVCGEDRGRPRARGRASSPPTRTAHRMRERPPRSRGGSRSGFASTSSTRLREKAAYGSASSSQGFPAAQNGAMPDGVISRSIHHRCASTAMRSGGSAPKRGRKVRKWFDSPGSTTNCG